MEGREDKHVCLVKEMEAEMVPFNGSTEPTTRIGWFLNLPSISAHDPKNPSFVPSLYKPISPMALQAPRVHFHGWTRPTKQWVTWVAKMTPVYQHLWKKAGIFDAIQASKCHIRKDPSSLFGVAGFWCGETNSFIFPLLEATITLEDVIVLGGFPVIGEPVRGALDGELAEIELRMIVELKRFNKSTCKKTDHNAWMRYYMEGEGEGGELEHIAFLSLWVSRYVFPAHPWYTVGQYVLPIAIRLAKGARVALAPAVLATLYRDLRRMKEYLVLSSKGSSEEAPLVLWAPFSILQMWVWERFVALRPESPVTLSSSDPRAQRWHDTTEKLDLSFVGSILVSPETFMWRPYGIRLGDWRLPTFYKDNGMWLHGKDGIDEGLESFVQCLRACELLGIDCVEQYHPHRVAMQFGLDQDVPNQIPCGFSASEVEWKISDVTKKNFKAYVPPRLLESEITMHYSVWWREYMMAIPVAVGSNDVPHSTWKVRKKGSVVKKRMQDRNAEGSLTKTLERKKRQKLSSTPSVKKRKLQDGLPLNLEKSLKYVSEEKKRQNGYFPKFKKKKLQGALSKNVEGVSKQLDGPKLKLKKEKVQGSALKKFGRLPNKVMKQNKQRKGSAKKKHVEDFDVIPPSNLFALGKHAGRQTASTASILQKQPKCAEKPQIHVETKLSLNSETASQSSDASGEIKVEREIMKAKFAFDTLDIKDSVVLEDVKRMNVAESAQSVVAEDASIVVGTEEKERSTEEDENESQFELDIRKCKEEIASLQARIRELESQAQD